MKFSKIIKKPHLKPAIFLLLLISLFVVGNHLQYHFYGIPYSSEYDGTGSIRGELFIYDQEVVASKWLSNYSDADLKIYADSIGGSRLMLGNIDIYRARGINFDKNKTIPDYLYLGYVGTRDGKVYETLDVISDWFNFDFLFQGKSRIYDNNYSEVYLWPGYSSYTTPSCGTVYHFSGHWLIFIQLNTSSTTQIFPRHFTEWKPPQKSKVWMV